MTKKVSPSKPSSPLGTIMFLPSGTIRKVIEPLPELKENLERTIVDKFINALARDENRHIKDIRKADPWPDFEGQEEDNRIGIEIVEVVNAKHNIWRKRQKEYEIAILELLGDRVKLFNGLEIILNDNYQSTPYPSINSIEGKKIVNNFIQNLLACVDEINACEVKSRFIFEWQTESGKPSVGIFGSRFAAKEMNIPPYIGFRGTFPESLEEVLSHLTEAIQHKISRSYTNYAKGRLILLVYEVGTPSVILRASEAIRKAQDVIKRSTHHFSEIWYIFPHPGNSFGSLYRVWSSDICGLKT